MGDFLDQADEQISEGPADGQQAGLDDGEGERDAQYALPARVMQGDARAELDREAIRAERYRHQYGFPNAHSGCKVTIFLLVSDAPTAFLLIFAGLHLRIASYPVSLTPFRQVCRDQPGRKR